MASIYKLNDFTWNISVKYNSNGGTCTLATNNFTKEDYSERGPSTYVAASCPYIIKTN